MINHIHISNKPYSHMTIKVAQYRIVRIRGKEVEFKHLYSCSIDHLRSNLMVTQPSIVRARVCAYFFIR